MSRGDRVILGIAGCPGAGKSTLAKWIVDEIDPAHEVSVWMPMDGFHLADRELTRLGRLQRKGAVDTFDGYGYIATLERLRNDTAVVVYAPEFDRRIEQPVAGSVPIFSSAQLVVTEGNYLLNDSSPWARVHELLDEIWYCDVDNEVRRERLVQRHIMFGKSPEEARNWVNDVDEPNAQQIELGRDRADLIISADAAAPTFNDHH